MAYRFNASSLNRTTNLPPIFNFTIMGWFMLPSAPTANGAFFSFGTTSGAYIELYTNSSSQFRAYSSGSASASETLVTGRWYHMALVCRGSDDDCGGIGGVYEGVLDCYCFVFRDDSMFGNSQRAVSCTNHSSLYRGVPWACVVGWKFKRG